MGLELELELLPSQLPPIRTARPDGGGGEGDDNAAVADAGCATPKAAANVLRPPSACPPAPRKPRPPKRKLPHHRAPSCGSAAPVRWFIAVPNDVLAAVFVARPAAASVVSAAPCPTSPARKKIRLHLDHSR
ncbi:hypothetical protein U9M48_025515 [Paspalum notatum var. saurae]|uniref:Uncharacterized protein n=1 Tax=Paspalum notatum var. saurae TaxID=547442 RepID=A0AAQ3TQW1_PASNO